MPVSELGESESLAGKPAGEGVSALLDGMAAVYGIGHELRNGGAVRWVWAEVNDTVLVEGRCLRSPKGNSGTQDGGLKTISSLVPSMRINSMGKYAVGKTLIVEWTPGHRSVSQKYNTISTSRLKSGGQ